jgi:rubrerythrin
MSCKCKQVFCYNCGTFAIEQHECLNGCTLQSEKSPQEQVREKLKRDINEEERRHLDWIEGVYRGRTEFERQYVKEEIMKKLDKFNPKERKVKDCIKFIVWNNE